MNKKAKVLMFLILLVGAVSGGVFFSVKNNTTAKDEIAQSDDDLQCPDCNLVIISLTNTRKKHLGIYGYERDTAPHVGKFFDRALVFENAFAPASWTLPVAASLFTSLFPDAHGVMDRYDGSRLSDGALTLAEIFKQNGYKTAGFTGGGDYNKKFNHAQGFDVYVDEGGSMGPGSYFGTEESVPQAIAWLETLRKKDKFFLFVQGFDTHCPFTPEESFKEKFLTPGEVSSVDYSTCLWTFGKTEPLYEEGVRYWPVKSMFTKNGVQEIRLTDGDVKYMTALYDAKIAQADSNLEPLFKIFEEKGLTKNTIFIFMAEHGDMLGEHGRFMRGGPLRGTFYDPVINFPLLVKHPKIHTLTKTDILIQTVDLMPTLLEMVGLADEKKETRQGKSFLGALGQKEEINEYVYAASSYSAPKDNVFFNGFSRVETIRSKEWKLIKESFSNEKEILESAQIDAKGEHYELYHISSDSTEEHNMISEEKHIADLLKAKLNSWKDRL